MRKRRVQRPDRTCERKVLFSDSCPLCPPIKRVYSYPIRSDGKIFFSGLWRNIKSALNRRAKLRARYEDLKNDPNYKEKKRKNKRDTYWRDVEETRRKNNNRFKFDRQRESVELRKNGQHRYRKNPDADTQVWKFYADQYRKNYYSKHSSIYLRTPNLHQYIRQYKLGQITLDEFDRFLRAAFVRLNEVTRKKQKLDKS